MSLSELPEVIREALEGQPVELVTDTVETWRNADEETRADILAFFESDGPEKVRQAKLKVEGGVPTVADLERDMGPTS